MDFELKKKLHEEDGLVRIGKANFVSKGYMITWSKHQMILALKHCKLQLGNLIRIRLMSL